MLTYVSSMCLLGYQSYKYMTAKGSTEETSKQKKSALSLIEACKIVGIAYIALSLMPKGAIAATTCPIDNLKPLLEMKERDSKIVQVFQIFNETQGITCNNYLPWQDRFDSTSNFPSAWPLTDDYSGGSIENIEPKDMPQSAMWGIDRWQRPYLAFKYACENDFVDNTLVLTPYHPQTPREESDDKLSKALNRWEGCIPTGLGSQVGAQITSEILFSRTLPLFNENLSLSNENLRSFLVGKKIDAVATKSVMVGETEMSIYQHTNVNLA